MHYEYVIDITLSETDILLLCYYVHFEHGFIPGICLLFDWHLTIRSVTWSGSNNSHCYTSLRSGKGAGFHVVFSAGLLQVLAI